MNRCEGPRMSWRMVILNLILPMNLLVLMFVLFIQIWFLQFEVDMDGLETKRFLADPLLEVFSDKAEEDKRVPEWIALVVLEDGKVYYPADNLEEFFEGIIFTERLDKLQIFLSMMVKEIPSDMNIVPFLYQGQKGICFYFYDALPSAFKVLQKPRYLINLFLVTTLFFLLGAGIIFNLKKNMEELIQATRRLGEMDFDTPLIPSKDNELSDVFVAFEEMRKEMLQHRKQGMLMMMSITHDLKTPLTSIRGYLEAFRDGLVESKEEAMLIIGTLLNKTGLLEERINEMLDFAKLVSTDFESSAQSIPVREWLKELNGYFYEEAHLHNRHFTSLDDTPESLTLLGFEKRLSRTVINLFDNACRYTGANDDIRFTSGYDNQMNSLILRMEDSGSGVAPGDRERIFDLFYRKDKGRNTRGMGIGLASVKFLAELHGGSVACFDSPLGGACFEIRLPVEV